MLEGTDPYIMLLIFAAVILTVSMAGAYIPLIKKMDPRQVHLMVALSAGIFLGILFFMLLPETFEESPDAMDAVPWILGGFLAVLAVDVVLKRMHISTCPCEECCDEKDHGHKLISASAYAGLAIHSVVDGIILSIALTAGEDLGLVAIAGISVHKFADLFALSSTFRLTGLDKRSVIVYMIVFALITPAAAFISMPLMSIVEGLEIFIPLAVATGTFMYVGIYALLPEAFHERRDGAISFALVLTGIVAIALLSLMMGHAH